MNSLKKDITQHKDVVLLVHTFYEHLLRHEEMKPIFAELDLQQHLPKIIAFWEFVLLDKDGYTTNVFEKHMHLSLSEKHFEIWLNTFSNTVNLLFEGEKAQTAISRANVLGYTFQNKLKAMGKLI